MAEGKNTFKDILIKGLFVLGVFVIIIILAFAVIKIIPRVFSSFATVGNAIRSPFSSNDVDISTNNDDLNSGESTIVFWEYSPKEFGTYDIKYPCIDKLEVMINVNDGEKKLLCNTPYKLNSSMNSAEITPILNKTNSLVDLPLSIKFTSESGNVLAEGSLGLTVRNEADIQNGEGENASATITTETISEGEDENETPISFSTNNGNETTSPETPVAVPNTFVPAPGPTDLVITNITAVSNQVISFKISNVGQRNTGNWFFNYIDPSGKIEFSPLQASMRPGDAILYTLNFDNIASGIVRINVDPSNLIRESNETNNNAVVTIAGNGTAINTNTNTNFNSNDRADLEILVFEAGRLEGSRFVRDNEIDDRDEAAVRFVVKNVGGESTGTWRFELQDIPYDRDDYYRSGRQNSLRPGESKELIIGFDNPDEGNYRIELEVDSDNDVREESERNNEESERLEVRD